jgi:hypothetical protein
MFDNCDPNTNGELAFYNTHIKNNTNIIFDVGSRDDTLFNDFSGEVHYFEPDNDSLNRLKEIPKANRIAKYNNFGLGINNETCTYYSEFQSFINRDCGWLPIFFCNNVPLNSFNLLNIETSQLMQSNHFACRIIEIDFTSRPLKLIFG